MEGPDRPPIPRLNSENAVDEYVEAAAVDATDPVTLHPHLHPHHSVEPQNPDDGASAYSSDSNPHYRRPAAVGMTTGTSISSSGRIDHIHLSRVHTARSQHSGTVGESRSRAPRDLPPLGGGKPYPPLLPNKEDFLVEFTGADDPLHAQNWPFRQKAIVVVVLSYTTMVATFTSSVFSAATHTVAPIFHVSSEVALLGTSLYVLGFATGPTLWAPLSELKGRRLPILVSQFGFMVFCFAAATAKDFQTLMITRFFAGFFGACPLAVVAAIFADMFDNKSRGLAITVFAMTVFLGPMLAPTVGGFIVTSHLGWRWTMYIAGIMGALSLVLDIFLLKETYAPVILISKAELLRRHTKNWGIRARQEEVEVDFKELVTKNFTRPIRILFFEPIVLLVTIYMSFIYGLLYLFFTAYPLVFQGVHHMKPGPAGLCFFGMILGMLIAAIFIVSLQPRYVRKLEANNGVSVPEWRIPSIIVGAVVFPMGLFWFGWSGYKEDVHWIVPTASGICSGFGIFSIFLQSLNYLVDSYLMFAASAMAANTLMRSVCGAGFPLFATYMFNSMGIEWASTLLGCVAVALIPIPLCFLFWGSKIRERSKLAPTTSVNKAEDKERHDDRDVALHGSRPRREEIIE